jgi:hypothetical protein
VTVRVIKSHFKNSGTITIKNGINGINGTNGTNGIDGTNGTNGKDAITPIIGVKLYTDGFYYWTIDTGDGNGAQWLKDSNGNMIRTTGDKGDTGATGATGADWHSGQGCHRSSSSYQYRQGEQQLQYVGNFYRWRYNVDINGCKGYRK